MKARPFVIALVGAKQFQRNGFGGCIWTVPSFFFESAPLRKWSARWFWHGVFSVRWSYPKPGCFPK